MGLKGETKGYADAVLHWYERSVRNVLDLNLERGLCVTEKRVAGKTSGSTRWLKIRTCNQTTLNICLITNGVIANIFMSINSQLLIPFLCVPF